MTGVSCVPRASLTSSFWRVILSTQWMFRTGLDSLSPSHFLPVPAKLELLEHHGSIPHSDHLSIQQPTTKATAPHHISTTWLKITTLSACWYGSLAWPRFKSQSLTEQRKTIDMHHCDQLQQKIAHGTDGEMYARLLRELREKGVLRTCSYVTSSRSRRGWGGTMTWPCESGKDDHEPHSVGLHWAAMMDRKWST